MHCRRVQSERERRAVCYVPRISSRVRASRPMTLQSPTKWYRVALRCGGRPTNTAAALRRQGLVCTSRGRVASLDRSGLDGLVDMGGPSGATQ